MEDTILGCRVGREGDIQLLLQLGVTNGPGFLGIQEFQC